MLASPPTIIESNYLAISAVCHKLMKAQLRWTRLGPTECKYKTINFNFQQMGRGWFGKNWNEVIYGFESFFYLILPNRFVSSKKLRC